MKSTNDSFLRREISVKQLVALASLLYSVLIVATLAPAFGKVMPSALLIVYFLLVPGYCVTLLFHEDYDVLQRLLFSIFISMSLVLSLLALNRISHSFSIPISISLPVISISIIIYVYYYHRW